MLVPGFAYGVGQRFACDPGDRGFARRINVGEHQHIRQIERATELVPQMLRARKTVRLKQHQQTIELADLRRFQRGANLHRVMAVIVNDRDVVGHSLDVEAPPHAREFHQPVANQFHGNIQVQRHRGRRRGVTNVVNSGRMHQPEAAEIFSLERQGELAH